MSLGRARQGGLAGFVPQRKHGQAHGRRTLSHAPQNLASSSPQEALRATQVLSTRAGARMRAAQRCWEDPWGTLGGRHVRLWGLSHSPEDPIGAGATLGRVSRLRLLLLMRFGQFFSSSNGTPRQTGEKAEDS